MDESVISAEDVEYIDEPANENRTSDNELITDNIENVDEASSCKSTDSTNDNAETVDCNICGKSYKRKAHLLKHLMSHKSQSDSGGNNCRKRHYIFVCKKCGKRFSKSKALQNHENEGTCVEQEVGLQTIGLICWLVNLKHFCRYGATN